MRRSGIWLLLAMMLSVPAAPVRAEIGTGLSILSDSRFRGYSLSQGRPVMSLDLSYDDAEGPYVNGKLSAAATEESGVRFLSFTGNIGYARKLRIGSTLDVGIIHSRLTRYSGYGDAANYTEIYTGLIGKHLSVHIHYSPHYFRSGLSTVYADISAVTRPLPKWRINGHYGLLTQVGGERPRNISRVHHDWRLSITREAGPLDLQLALTGGAPGKQFYRDRSHKRKAVAVFGVTYFF